MKNYTLEGRKKSQNGIKRLIFSALAIILEICFLVFLATKLRNYAVLIDTVSGIFAIFLVLLIHARTQSASMKLPWIMLITSFPIFGLTFYLMVGLDGGTNTMRARYKKMDEILFRALPCDKTIRAELKEINPRAASISTYISNSAYYPVYRNTDVEYFDEAVKGLNAMIEDLSKAEKFIFMEYHAIEDGYAWEKVQTVLEERVKAGVEVRVFYDDMGSIWFVNMDFAEKLEKKGIKCRVFNPVIPFVNMFLNNRDHRKITVIDGKMAYTGGYNIANEYFNFTKPYGKWKDTGIKITGDAVRSLTVSFLEMWNASEKKSQTEDTGKYLVEYDYKSSEDGFIQPYSDSPLDDEQVGEEVYISMINKAEKYCWFVTPYLIISDEMTHALSLASKRGVDVRIITPGIPDKKIIYKATRSFYPALVKSGVRIFEWTPGFCHAKMSVADDMMATCGTINLDYRSLYHHFENGCFMAECEAVMKIKNDMETLMQQSFEVTKLYKNSEKKHLGISQLFIRLFAELL